MSVFSTLIVYILVEIPNSKLIMSGSPHTYDSPFPAGTTPPCSPYATPSHVRNPWLPPSGTSPIVPLAQRLAEDSNPSYVAPPAIKEGNAFYLPQLDATFLATGEFKDWKAMWDQQVKDTRSDALPPSQLKRILLPYIGLPMSPQFWRSTYTLSIDDIFAEIRKKCEWYRPVPEVLTLLPKHPDESFDEYLARHILEAQRLHVTYDDKALCALVYSNIPKELRCLVEKEWSENKPRISTNM